MTGQFIVIEGPNGVGKTTVAQLLAERLRRRQDAPVYTTREPSDTPLGHLLRSSEEHLTGRSLALAIAADRYAHLESEITPAIDRGHLVISDRYVQSSLVLQRLDGLSSAEIWRYNAYILPPTLSFYLEDEPAVIRQRLASRVSLSRLERVGTPAREIALYDGAFRFLARRGWRQFKIDCRGLAPYGVVDAMLVHLGKLVDEMK